MEDKEVLDGYLGAFIFGLAIGVIAVFFGSALRMSDFIFNPFNWDSSSDEDLWRS